MSARYCVRRELFSDIKTGPTEGILITGGNNRSQLFLPSTGKNCVLKHQRVIRDHTLSGLLMCNGDWKRNCKLFHKSKWEVKLNETQRRRGGVAWTHPGGDRLLMGGYWEDTVLRSTLLIASDLSRAEDGFDLDQPLW